MKQQMPDRLILASGNKGKLKEFRGMLENYGIEVLSMAQAGITEDIPENGQTLEDNALCKAQYVRDALLADGADLSRTLVLADDTGLCVDALDGAPGVYTARYAGEGASDEDRYGKLLRELEGIPDERRGAAFVCVLAVIKPDGETELLKGVMDGRIAHTPAGDNGFGYDPVFYLPQLGCTTARLTQEEKSEVSHRGKAMRLFEERMREWYSGR